MKKAIPVIIAIALICVVGFVSFGSAIYEKYSYGTEYADLNEYFGNPQSDDVPIVLQDEKLESFAKYKDGIVYFDEGLVKELFTVRFYRDTNENLLLYTNGSDTIRTEIGSKSYLENGVSNDTEYTISYIEDDTLYIAINYIQKFVNLYYEFYEEPYRMQLYTEWGSKTVADIKKDTYVRWRGGVKSEILRKITSGVTVEVLEAMDDWTKVKTDDAYIGYVPNDCLSDTSAVEETPVTKVEAEDYKNLSKGEKICLVWQNMEAEQDASFLYNACAKVEGVNVVSPTWYWLTDNDGNFTSIANADYVKAAANMGMEVWPLISNFHTGTDIDIKETLSYTSKREKIISGIIAETLAYGATGINVDFENIPSAASEDYIQFIRELCVAAHKNGLYVSVDNYVPSEYTAHYSREEQGLFADYVIIMGYDEHYVGSEPGSVSSISWMVEGIENTAKVVSKDKIINAIPFFTRVWKTSNGEVTSEAVDMPTAADFISRNGITVTLDDATGQNYGEMTSGGTYYQVWMEDTYSVTTRMNVIDTNGIAGVAAWALGQEIPEVWDIIEAYMEK